MSTLHSTRIPRGLSRIFSGTKGSRHTFDGKPGCFPQLPCFSRGCSIRTDGNLRWIVLQTMRDEYRVPPLCSYFRVPRPDRLVDSARPETNTSSVTFERAHKYSSNHREQLLASEVCGCFFCRSTFSPAEIEEWVDEVDGIETTALCPRCGIDSVIGSASGIELSPDFLAGMHRVWFGFF